MTFWQRLGFLLRSRESLDRYLVSEVARCRAETAGLPKGHLARVGAALALIEYLGAMEMAGASQSVLWGLRQSLVQDVQDGLNACRVASRQELLS